MNIQDFGKSIKGKYPQYKDMSDYVLGKQILLKYPQYQDMVEPIQVQRIINQPEEPKGILSKAGSFLKTVQQEISRSGASVALTYSNMARFLTGQDTVDEIDISGNEIENKIARVIFGDRPLESIERRMAKAEISIKDFARKVDTGETDSFFFRNEFGKHLLGTADDNPLFFAVLGIGATIGLDFTGLGGKKQAVTALAKTKDVAKIANILKRVGVSDDIIKATARGFVNITDEKVIFKALDNMDDITKASNVIADGIRGGTKITPLKAQTEAIKLVNTSGKVLDQTENYLKNITVSPKITLEQAEKLGFTKQASKYHKLAIDEYKQILKFAKNDLSRTKWEAARAMNEDGFKMAVNEMSSMQSNIKKLNSLIKKHSDAITKKRPFTVAEAQELGIAPRMTKTGNIVPSIRKSGFYVDKEFANYKNFKDVPGGITGSLGKDPTRVFQEMDGALPLSKLAKLPGQAGQATQKVLYRTRDFMKMRMNWSSVKEDQLKKMIKGISDGDALKANKVLVKISDTDALLSTKELLKRKDIAKITTDENIIRFAKESRIYFDDILKEQNKFRKLRNQELIPYRKHYSPEQIKKMSLWEQSYGFGKESKDIMGAKTSLPDFIHPDKPFIAHERARITGLSEFSKEMNLKKILENYTNTASKDIFNTSIIQNNKAFAQQLDNMGLKGSARFVQDWTTEAFAGLRSPIDRALIANTVLDNGFKWWRRALIKGVFPLNIAWNTFVQTSSAALTFTRYGTKNTVSATWDWFTNPNVRKEISENAYSYMVKTGKAGKVTSQDLGTALNKGIKLEKSKLDNVVDAANYFTEWTEKHLTGISVQAAKKHGSKKGLKGKALWEFASDGGAKTQSMYNLEDLPGILRSEMVKTVAPFQTFSFEVFNTMREFAGKTGVPPEVGAERIKWFLRFAAGIAAVNQVGGAAIGREPWQTSAFIPFYATLAGPIEMGLLGETTTTGLTRGLPSPVGILADLTIGMNNWIESGDTTKLRRWGLRYVPGMVGIPAGLQASRIVDGIIAISDGGVTDKGGKMMFPIYEDKDKIRAIFSGPWSTTGGQEYWDERGKGWLDLLTSTKERITGEADMAEFKMPESTKSTRGIMPGVGTPRSSRKIMPGI